MMVSQMLIRFLHWCKKVVLSPERIVYTRFVIPYLVKRIRKKKQIDVAFVVFELASWKTESLYNMMRDHLRFRPKLIIAPSLENVDEVSHVEDYLSDKGYIYYRIKKGDSIRKLFHPDIIFYQKPYNWCIDRSLFFRRNLQSLFCYMSYCFRNTNKDFNQNTLFHNYAWQVYAENNSVKEEMQEIMDNQGKNVIVTGLTVMDDLMHEKSFYHNPWHEQGPKKKVIYAPHHTINNEIVHRSTFLQLGEFMLQVAEKYKDQVQWAFKPHPLLKKKLIMIWGEEKTNAYYEKWNSMENAQVENGEYMGLFKYSDAMIHDSGSFMLEYLYTKNPVMYLVSDSSFLLDANEQTLQAFEAHYHGQSEDEVESFIVNLLQGIDTKYDERLSFYQTHLIPPGGVSVGDNVINAILGISNAY